MDEQFVDETQLKLSDYEHAHAKLDEMSIPRNDGEYVLSLWGRIQKAFPNSFNLPVNQSWYGTMTLRGNTWKPSDNN